MKTAKNQTDKDNPDYCLLDEKKKASDIEQRKLIPKDATIVVRFNAGWGNNLFIHGEGANLNWEKGTPLTNISEEYWYWKAAPENKERLSFKITINGKTWAEGENIELKPGQKIEIEPKFLL